MADPAPRRADRVRRAENDGLRIATWLATNFVEGDHEVIRAMLSHPDTVTGLVDAGAHVKLICDASMPSTALTHWCRSRTRGEHLPIELIVGKQTRRNARLYGPA